MRKIVFILLAVVICFSPVGVSSQNIFQKAANKISSWFSGGEKERASDKTGHITTANNINTIFLIEP